MLTMTQNTDFRDYFQNICFRLNNYDVRFPRISSVVGVDVRLVFILADVFEAFLRASFFLPPGGAG